MNSENEKKQVYILSSRDLWAVWCLGFTFGVVFSAIWVGMWT